MIKTMDPKRLTGENNFFLPLLLLIPILYLIFKHISLKGRSLPPGPYPWPIVGNIFQMGKKPHVSLTNLAQVYGPLMSLRFGTQLVVVGSLPAAAKEILKTHDRILSARYVPHALPVKSPTLNHLSLGFSNECNDHWKYLRAVCQAELFSTKALESQVKMRERKVMEMVEYLGAKEGEAVKVGAAVFVTIYNILSNVFFSMDFIDFEGKGVGAEMKELVNRNMELGSTPNFSDFYPILGGFDIQGIRKKSENIFGRMASIWEAILKERRKQRSNVSNPRDFLDALIEIGFGDDQINQLIVELFGAGIDTSSSTIEWAMAELIKNKEVMHKLRNELANEIGGDIVRESHLSHLPYLQACVKETFRLHPTGPLLLPHRAQQTCQVMGYTIPKDTQVIVNMWAIGRDPATWNDPLSFRPERFLVSGLDFKGSNFEFIPFSSGRRICPGLPMAARQIPLILASLIHLFDWVLPGNMDPAELDMNGKLAITLQKEQPLHLIPTARK